MSPERIRDAAEVAEYINARDGLDTDMSISPSYMREVAQEREDRP